MNKIKWIVFVLLAILLIATPVSANPYYPPARYYGEVENGRVGQFVTTNFHGYTRTFAYEDKVVYVIDLEGGQAGDNVYFFVNGWYAGKGTYIQGGNQQVNLTARPPLRIFRYFLPLVFGGIQ